LKGIEVKQHCILIVDDDKDFREMIAEYLQDEGFCTLQARNGEIALENIEREKPDLIILDIHLPTGNGLDICRRLKSRTSTRDIPIIIVTGRASIQNMRSSYLAGAKRYLVKPLEMGELGECVHNILPEVHHDNPSECFVLSE
jgi:two-component system, OmpR family, phosphate regulon response regulator PhoB